MRLVYLLGEINPKLLEKLTSIGIGTTTELKDVSNIEGIVVRGEIPVDKELITKLPHLKLIASAGIGYDNIDLKAALERGILVVNCPYANSLSTGEHSVALMLSGMKNVVKATNELKKGIWDRKSNVTVQCFDKSVGIVGFGRVGRYVGQLLSGLGMRVYAYDPFVPPYHFYRSRVTRISSLEELFSLVSFISVHLPRTDETMGLINRKLIKKLKQPNGIVNTARGGIVVEEDVIEALNKGILDFYGADVFVGEPKNLNKTLLESDRVLVTPHIAANSVDAQDQVMEDVLAELERVLIRGEDPKFLVETEHL